jgi:hypothetical protein
MAGIWDTRQATYALLEALGAPEAARKSVGVYVSAVNSSITGSLSCQGMGRCSANLFLQVCLFLQV